MELEHRTWLAALIDGEGSIIDRVRPGRSFAVVVVIANNNGPLLLAAQERAGAGRIYRSKRDTLQLRIERRMDVIRVLSEVEPHLIVKRDRARLALSRLLAGHARGSLQKAG